MMGGWVLKKSHIFILEAEGKVDRENDKEEQGIMQETGGGGILGQIFRSRKCHENQCFICLKHVTWEMVEELGKREK